MHNPEKTILLQQHQNSMDDEEVRMTDGELSGNNSTTTRGINECAGCGKCIKDKFLLKSMDKLYHADCLTCNCCSAKLGELGSSLYFKAGLILCRRDYLRMFGSSGYCSACNKEIQPYEFVMRSQKPNLVFHLNCFSCSLCNYRFCVGDRYYIENTKILCEYDHQERMIFKQMATSPLLRKQVTEGGSSDGGTSNNYSYSQIPHSIQSPPPPQPQPQDNLYLDKIQINNNNNNRKCYVHNIDESGGAGGGGSGYGSPDSGIRMDAEYN